MISQIRRLKCVGIKSISTEYWNNAAKTATLKSIYEHNQVA